MHKTLVKNFSFKFRKIGQLKMLYKALKGIPLEDGTLFCIFLRAISSRNLCFGRTHARTHGTLRSLAICYFETFNYLTTDNHKPQTTKTTTYTHKNPK